MEGRTGFEYIAIQQGPATLDDPVVPSLWRSPAVAA